MTKEIIFENIFDEYKSHSKHIRNILFLLELFGDKERDVYVGHRKSKNGKISKDEKSCLKNEINDLHTLPNRTRTKVTKEKKNKKKLKMEKIKKKGFQVKDFRYALEKGFIEKQKKRIEKKGTVEKGKGEIYHNLRKSQEVFVKDAHNLRKSKRNFGNELKPYYNKKTIDKDCFSPSRNGQHIERMLNKLCYLEIINKDGTGKDAYYTLRKEFKTGTTYKLRNLALIDEYIPDAIKRIEIVPDFKSNDLKAIFPKCSVILYGLPGLTNDERNEIQDIFTDIEKSFSKIADIKIKKYFETGLNIKILENAKSKRLNDIFNNANEDEQVCFINTLIGYFLQEYPTFDKEDIVLETIRAWISVKKEEESEKYKKNIIRFEKIIKKYCLNDTDLKEALERGIEVFYGNIPIEPGFSMFYAPVLNFQQYVKKYGGSP